MLNAIPRHRVFASFHEKDRYMKERFIRLMGNHIVDESVDTGNIDDTGLTTDRVRQIIRDGYIRDATVTVVLIGPETWQRKHVDWEIGSSIRKTKKNSRCGLLGIILPNHPDYNKSILTPNLIPPRLADNAIGNDPYAGIYSMPCTWTQETPVQIAQWIHQAFMRRSGSPPNNSYPPFRYNKTSSYRATSKGGIWEIR